MPTDSNEWWDATPVTDGGSAAPTEDFPLQPKPSTGGSSSRRNPNTAAAGAGRTITPRLPASTLSPRHYDSTTPLSTLSSGAGGGYTEDKPLLYPGAHSHPGPSTHGTDYHTPMTHGHNGYHDDKIPDWNTYHHDHHLHHRVDRNAFKRNMTIAKGFLDISLLAANANQLKTLLCFGDSNYGSYYVIMTGLLASIVLQLVTGFLLIIMERWNINKVHHQPICERFNNATVVLVFLTVVINIMVSTQGVGLMTKHFSTTQSQHGVLHILPPQPRLNEAAPAFSNVTI